MFSDSGPKIQIFLLSATSTNFYVLVAKQNYLNFESADNHLSEFFLQEKTQTNDIWSFLHLKGKLLILKEIMTIKMQFAFFYQTFKTFNTHILNLFANDLPALNTLW